MSAFWNKWALGSGLLALLGCVTPGHLSNSSAGPGPVRVRGLREFFVRPGVTQYFLPAQQLAGPQGRTALLDLVVRDSAAVPLYALLHVSLIEPTIVSFTAADTLLLSTAGRPLPVAAPRILFAEPKGKGQLTRLEVPLSPAQATAFLHSPSPGLWVSRAGLGRLAYQPSKKALAALRALAGVATPGQ